MEKRTDPVRTLFVGGPTEAPPQLAAEVRKPRYGALLVAAAAALGLCAARGVAAFVDDIALLVGGRP